MTPKEKAEQLVNAMGISVSYGINYTSGDNIPMYRNQYAKQCALIAVEEIINIWEYSDTQEKWWWQQVKQEIEKL